MSVNEAEMPLQPLPSKSGALLDEKLLIIHCDDLALAHSVNEAAFRALDEGCITSASVMTTCPWLPEVAAYARQHKNFDLGVHLTLTSEWPNYRWGPVAPLSTVRSLLDPQGYLWCDVPSMARHADPNEVVIELEAQVARALACGLRPTHLDTHMFALVANRPLLSAYIGIARKYRLPFLFPGKRKVAPGILSSLREDEILLNACFSANQSWQAEAWCEHYVSCLHALESGVSQIIVHLALDDGEMRAIQREREGKGWDSAWRQRDLDVVTSARFKEELERTKTRLVGWQDLKVPFNGEQLRASQPLLA